jgi:hypothetical protein
MKLAFVLAAVVAALCGTQLSAQRAAVPVLNVGSANVVGGEMPAFRFPSKQEDAAADSVAVAFAKARDAAHLTKLERMGRNGFRANVCKNDDRFDSGVIDVVRYQTTEPAQLPDAAQNLALHTDHGDEIAARFGVGTCAAGADSSGRSLYSVIIVTYASRWNSFLRFWD